MSKTSDCTFVGSYGLMNELTAKVPEGKLYDTGKGNRPPLGGTTNFVYHLKHRTVKSHFLSLAGTVRNCAGAPRLPIGQPLEATWLPIEDIENLKGKLRENTFKAGAAIFARGKRNMAWLRENLLRLHQRRHRQIVAPWGDVILCEDSAEDQYVRGITPEHSAIFVNIQVPGIPLAITGPWEKMSRIQTHSSL